MPRTHGTVLDRGGGGCKSITDGGTTLNCGAALAHGLVLDGYSRVYA